MNLMRAAKLTAVSNAEMLRLDESLRLRGASYAELLALAAHLAHACQVPNVRRSFAKPPSPITRLVCCVHSA